MADLVAQTYLNIYSPADSPTWTVATAGAYPYEVYDLWGPVASGTTDGTTTVTIPRPAGGWPLGSYRVYLPTVTFSTNFTVIDQTDTRFPAKPVSFARPYSAYGYANTSYIAGYDPIMHGVFGTGPERLTVANVGDPTVYSGANDMIKAAQAGQAWYNNPTYADPAHAHEQLCALGSSLSGTPAVDTLILNDVNGPGFAHQSVNIYPASASVNGATTYVGVAAGTSSGFKLTIYSPNSTTVVETYDNLASNAAAQTAVNAASAYIRMFNQKRGGNPAPIAPVAIGNAGLSAVTSLAGQLYSAGVTWFEGPWNEPQDAIVEQVVHQFNVWAQAVKAGAPNGKTCGPGPVSYNTQYQPWITNFLGLVDRTTFDGLSVHAYNTHNGDVRLTRQCLVDLRGILTAQGLSTLPVWQTEQGWQWPWYGVDRGRSAVNYYLLFMLMMEQYGIPPERNYLWYDVDNLFWLMSLIKAGNSQVLHPLVPAIRGLKGERHGKTYTGALDFGTPGNDHYIGNVYTAPDGSKSLALLNCGEGDGGRVTFTVTGAASLVRLDCFGNQSTVPVVGGSAVVDVGNTPTYLRVPVGATATPVKRDYGTDLLLGATVTPSGGSKAAASRITTAGLWSSYYNGSAYASGGNPSKSSPWQSASATLPQTVTITRAAAATADTVVVRAATLWQDLTTLLDFDVQVSADGTTWQTVYTYTKDPTTGYVQRTATEEPTAAFQSRAEQWDDERFLWVVPFTARSVKAVQLVIRAVTPGGALDATTSTAMQGSNTAGPTSTYPTLTSVQLYSTGTVAPATKYIVRTIA